MFENFSDSYVDDLVLAQSDIFQWVDKIYSEAINNLKSVVKSRIANLKKGVPENTFELAKKEYDEYFATLINSEEQRLIFFVTLYTKRMQDAKNALLSSVRNALNKKENKFADTVENFIAEFVEKGKYSFKVVDFKVAITVAVKRLSQTYISVQFEFIEKASTDQDFFLELSSLRNEHIVDKMNELARLEEERFVKQQKKRDDLLFSSKQTELKNLELAKQEKLERDRVEFEENRTLEAVKPELEKRIAKNIDSSLMAYFKTVNLSDVADIATGLLALADLIDFLYELFSSTRSKLKSNFVDLTKNLNSIKNQIKKETSKLPDGFESKAIANYIEKDYDLLQNEFQFFEKFFDGAGKRLNVRITGIEKAQKAIKG